MYIFYIICTKVILGEKIVLDFLGCPIQIYIRVLAVYVIRHEPETFGHVSYVFFFIDIYLCPK